MTTDRRGPTLAWSNTGGALPQLIRYDNRRVRWYEWEIAPLVSHVDLTCEVRKCRYDGQPWMTFGVVDPLPGETYPWPEERRLPSGRVYLRDRDQPAWAVIRLVAYRCPACKDLRVYDQGQDGKRFDLVDMTPSLFDVDREFGDPVEHDALLSRPSERTDR
ncbi:hypothetical protein [Saccharothrix hoggarensis]|uniref:Uncharacterized protein n=1 Tax=Saccharothrix hoggarensis TaxID=913853 RepID=A0ABW3QKJ2_9PSEU